MTDGPSLAAVYDRVAAHLVGRERELTLVLAAVAAGRDIILEGPPTSPPPWERSSPIKELPCPSM
jgi:MoxR-like ATPase